MNYHKTKTLNELDHWVSIAPKDSMLVINTLVGWLAEDPYWVVDNISQVDKELLKELVGRMP